MSLEDRQKIWLDILKKKKVNIWKLLLVLSDTNVFPYPLEDYNNGKKDKLTQEEFNTLKEWLQ